MTKSTTAKVSKMVLALLLRSSHVEHLNLIVNDASTELSIINVQR